MDVIGNNIANVNTTGFKAGRVDFADSFSQTIRASAPGEGDVTGTAAMQVGSGVTTSAVRNLYTQGAVARTGVDTDLAISGEGYFVVRDPASGSPMVTRAGDFRVDENGYFVTSNGLRLQGYSDSALSVVGDLRIDLADKPADISDTATLSKWAIDREGKLRLSLSDGSQFVRGQILLQRFSDPQGLVKEGNNLYSGIGAAGPLGGADSPTPGKPTESGLGAIQSGSLELSNVDLANEFSSMITAQRAFQATARIISTSDEMLQELVNLKR